MKDGIPLTKQSAEAEKSQQKATMTKMVNLDRFKRDLPSPATSSGKSIPKPWRGGLSGSFFLWLQIPSLKTRSHYELMSNLLTIIHGSSSYHFA